MFKKIKYWFIHKRQLEKIIDDRDNQLVSLEYLKNKEINILKLELLYKVSQSRAAEILSIKPLEDTKEMGATVYREYLAEAETIYRLRPWRDIINKFQTDQLKYIMEKTDGGELGLLQQMVCRGGIIFADYAENEINKLHSLHLEVMTGNKELTDEEKYKIFN